MGAKLIQAKSVAVVTGATGGIGRATSMRLSEDGFFIVAHYCRDAAGAEELRSLIEQSGGGCAIIQADLSRDSGVDRLVKGVADVLSADTALRVRALVNCAAKLLGPSFLDAKPDDFVEYFNLNTKAPFFLSQQLSLKMTTGGSIVNVSSAAAHFSSPGDIVYTMSKAAIESLTANAAEVLGPRGVRINTIVPGFTDNGHEAFRMPELLDHMSSFSVIGGVSDPRTVAEAIAFLASDRSSRTTGSILDVSGGSTLGARHSKTSLRGALTAS